MATKAEDGRGWTIPAKNTMAGAIGDLGEWWKRCTALAAERVLKCGGTTDRFAFAMNQQNANARPDLEPEEWLQIMVGSLNAHQTHMRRGKQSLEKHLRLSLRRIRLARSYGSGMPVDGGR